MITTQFTKKCIKFIFLLKSTEKNVKGNINFITFILLKKLLKILYKKQRLV